METGRREEVEGRLEAAWNRFRGRVVVIGGVAAAGALAALWFRHGCFHPPPPVVEPDPGTPRANLCDAVDAGSPWPILVLLPTGVAAVLSLFVPLKVIVPLGGAVILALFVVALLANTLNAAFTI
jgi:hypothetical protein